MPNNWSGLEQFQAKFLNDLRESMDIIARNGEYWVKQGHQEWNNDTKSLIASVTGYEATIGDPYRNFGELDWQFAQEFGSPKYNNPPEHYMPVEATFIETTMESGENNPTAVVTIWTKYPSTMGGGGLANVILGEEVDATLMGALDEMASELEGHLKYFLFKD